MKLANKTKVLKAARIAVDVLLVLLIVGLIYNIGSASVACSAQCVITVRGVREYYETEDLTVDIYRPEVSGFSDKAFEKLLNETIENEISAERNALELYSEEREHHNRLYFGVDYYLKSTKGIFSLKVRTICDFGWITALPTTIYYNADISNNKLLTLDDLFADRSYFTRLKAFLTTAIAQKYSEYNVKFFHGVSDKTQFFIENNSLYIAFAKYEIGDGSIGEPEFLIPTEEIRDLLKDDYKQILK